MISFKMRGARQMGAPDVTVRATFGPIKASFLQPRIVLFQDPIKAIVADVIEGTGVTIHEIYSPRRSRRIAYSRQAAMWLAVQCLPRSLPWIGRHFARDHTTVLWAVKAVDERTAADPKFRARMLDLRAKHMSAPI